MSRLSVNGEQYSQSSIEQAELAESLGWKVDDSRLYHRDLIFSKGKTYIWKSGYTHSPDSDGIGFTMRWQVADLIDGRFCNHRPQDTLELALKSNIVY